MNKEQKAAVVEELAEQIRSADTIFAVDYRGISVSQAADLRSRLRDAETRFRVVKNSLTERATDQAGAEALKAMLEGPTALAFVSGDAALAARALNDAGRALGTLEFKGGLMNGAALTADDVRSIARLPSRDVLNGQLVGMIASPLAGLVRTLNALIAGVAVQLQQIAEQGLVGAETAPASEAESSPAPEAEAESSPAPEAEAESSSAPEAEAESSPAPEAEAESSPAPEAEAESSPAPEAAAGEAEAAEDAPAEVAEEPAPEAAPEPSEQTETEAASDAESSEA